MGSVVALLSAMAYGPEARAVRRCRGRRSDGERCRAWAVWDDPRGLCMAHAGRHHKGPMPPKLSAHQPARYRPCTCAAYSWPDRPGGGLCRWPEPPTAVSLIQPSTHRWLRLRRSLRPVDGWPWPPAMARPVAFGFHPRLRSSIDDASNKRAAPERQRQRVVTEPTDRGALASPPSGSDQARR